MSEELQDNLKRVSDMFWVTQTELTNTMFQLLTPEMVGLLEKVKELSVVNATIAKNKERH